jgi:hypothetical protein
MTSNAGVSVSYFRAWLWILSTAAPDAQADSMFSCNALMWSLSIESHVMEILSTVEYESRRRPAETAKGL